MVQKVEALYENGVFRPLGALNLKESTVVKLSISDSTSVESEVPDFTDQAMLAYARARTAALTHVPTLEEVQERLSKIPGSLAEVIAAEREER